MTLLELNEPVIKTLLTVLESGLTGQVETLNSEATDSFEVDTPAQLLAYMPFAATLAGGLPAVGIQDLNTTFFNDLQHSMEAEHTIAVVTVIQTADHETLAWQLRRYNQAILRTIQADRQLGVLSVMRKEALVEYVKFTGVQWGPLLADRNPDAEGEPPTSFRSWTGITLECRRQEVGG
jgi:hypothetical protein